MRINKFKLVALLFMIATKIYGYDFSAKNSEGIDIYYSFVDGKKSVKVTYCEDYYYYGNVVIPESAFYNGRTYKVTSIGVHAFYECWDLESVSIPNSVTSIGNEAFAGCTGLTSITIPNSVTSIGAQAFACCGLITMALPNSVTSLGGMAFRDCLKLTSFTLPVNVKRISARPDDFGNTQHLLTGCISLQKLIVASGNSVYDSRDNCNAIIETATNTLIMGCSNTVIPNSVTAIDRYAFWRMGLTNITIPNSVKTIGMAAFRGCTYLHSVTISNSVTSIEEETFMGCNSLESVIIPNGIKSIDNFAFYNCRNLSSVTIPNSVMTIGNSAFQNCGLTSVTIPYSVTSIGWKSFNYESLKEIICLPVVPPLIHLSQYSWDVTAPEAYSNCVLYVPRGCYSSYYNSDWKIFNIIERNMTVLEALSKGMVKEGARYDMNGVRLKTLHKGLNILRMSDGTTKKIMVR